MNILYAIIKRIKNAGDRTSCRDFPTKSALRAASDSDRSNIRVLQERMADQHNPSWLSGSRDAQESFSKALIETSKSLNLFYSQEQCEAFGNPILIRSGESHLYENQAKGYVYKVRNPFAKLHLKSHNLYDLLYEHIIHNILFPDTRYTFVGITEELGEARIIYSQQLFFDTNIPTQKQIDKYLLERGLNAEKYYYYGNEYVAVTDVNATADNVMLSGNKKLLFIDPVIYIRQDCEQVIKYLLED